MLDVEVPAGVDPAGGRAARPGAAMWTEQRRPLLVAGSFVVAIVLGVVLGLAWASDDAAPPEAPVAEQPDNSILRSPQQIIPWDNGVPVGGGIKVSLEPQERETLREPLKWLVAYDQRQRTGATTPVAGDVEITENTVYYGAIRGANIDRDEFWAVGMAKIRGVPEADVANPYLWKRVGGGPWTLVDHGPQACGAIPPAMRTAWGGGPNSCPAA